MVILKEGCAFIGVHRVNHRYIIKTKLIIHRPIDVTSHHRDCSIHIERASSCACTCVYEINSNWFLFFIGLTSAE